MVGQDARATLVAVHPILSPADATDAAFVTVKVFFLGVRYLVVEEAALEACVMAKHDGARCVGALQSDRLTEPAGVTRDLGHRLAVQLFVTRRFLVVAVPATERPIAARRDERASATVVSALLLHHWILKPRLLIICLVFVCARNMYLPIRTDCAKKLAKCPQCRRRRVRIANHACD